MMECFRRYRFRFEAFGLILFALIMIPNIIWFAFPASNDVLRTESVTPVLDGIASAFQILMVLCLCFVHNSECKKIWWSKGIALSCAFCLLYYALWALYYLGMTNAFVMLGLALFPCAAFIAFALDRKNIVALIPALVFTVCHLIYAVVNHFG